MSGQLMDPSTYPVSAATAEVLRRPLFGHLIDGEHVASVDGDTLPVINPASGQEIAIAADQMVYPTAPYGGFKLSGHGKMLGAAFVDEMTQIKSVWMKVGV